MPLRHIAPDDILIQLVPDGRLKKNLRQFFLKTFCLPDLDSSEIVDYKSNHILI